jgi:hypothetical protein
MPRGAKRTPQDQVVDQLVLQRIEKMLLRGITSVEDMAAALSVNSGRIRKAIKIIHVRWQETESDDATVERRLRVRQLDGVVQMAINAFEKSTVEMKEVIVSKRRCYQCKGQGTYLPRNGVKKLVCSNCGGEGHTEDRIEKTRGLAGDPAFLNIAKSAISEAAKLQGLYPDSQNGRVSRTLVKEVQQVGGEVNYLELV